MIKKLKVKFVILAMAALFCLLTVIIAGMNLINYSSVVKEADTILSILPVSKGKAPDVSSHHMTGSISPEIQYESRYFSVVLNNNDDVVIIDTSKIVSIDMETAENYVSTALDSGREKGFTGRFRFSLVRLENGMSRMVFLDCGKSLDSFYGFLWTSIIMAVVGMVIVFIVIFILSGRIIKPIAESYEKQKRFITDAGHEIKTPLTIISANVDILEMELGENESLCDIRNETKRLRSLTEELVELARMEEAESGIQKIEFPISEVVEETAKPFIKLAASQKKEIQFDIQPLLTLKGDSGKVKKLVNIFLDNAMKYSPEGGKILLKLNKQNRSICLSVYNTTENKVEREQLSHVFDRFYRTDTSRNSETGGHGIGLSIAKAILNAHGGKISAQTEDEKSFLITAVFPV